MKQHCETLLIEIRTEELPPKQVWRLAENFPTQLLAELQQIGFANENTQQRLGQDNQVLLLATPRRFVALIDGVLSVGADTDYFRKGPKADACFDNNKPTKALLGFMNSVGVASVDDLTEVVDKEQRHFAFKKVVAGKPLCDEITAIVEKLLLAQNAPRQMRWGENTFKFIRPIRGVLIQYGRDALVGEKILDVITTDRTMGHPMLCDDPIKIAHANDYITDLEKKAHVIVDMRQRQSIIETQSNQAGNKHPDLLAEVTAMTEYPQVYVGQIDEQFLSLPAFCVEGCMIKHQRAFPMLDATEQLSVNYQLVADNQPSEPQSMISGFNKVLRARLQDVAFYIEQDEKLSLDDCLQQLKSVVYHHRLGSQFERVLRLQKIIEVFANTLEMSATDTSLAQKAMRVCKADLSTLLISEYPEFEGWVAAYYFCKNDSAVANLVRYHHTRDRQIINGLDVLGKLIVLVNHLEKLVAMFGIGEKPSGSKDPYGCRVSAGVVADIHTLLGQTHPLLVRQMPLDKLIAMVADVFPPLVDFSVDEVWQFIIERKKQALLDNYSGVTTKSILNAVFALPQAYMYDAECKMQAVMNILANHESAPNLIEINKRINNILHKSQPNNGIRDGAEIQIQPELLQVEAEKNLYQVILNADAVCQEAFKENNYEKILTHTILIKPAIDAFFESVFVNDENPNIRNNRLALLKQLQQFLMTVADLTQLS